VGYAAACAALLAAGLKGQLQYRANFVIDVVMGLVFQGTGFAFIWVVLARFQAVAGWTIGEVAFLYGLRLTAHALWGLAFGYMTRVGWLVRRGELDRYLLRPMPALLYLSVERVHVGAIGDMIGGLALLLAASRAIAVDWSPLALGYLVLAVAGGALVEAAVRLFVNAFAFRLVEMGAANFILETLFSNFGTYPLSIYTAAVRIALTVLVPVAFVAYVPAAVLLARTGELQLHPLIAYGAPLVGVVLFALAHRFWRGQLRHYQSAGH
jgi:ABC-2 type transport system permease protein